MLAAFYAVASVSFVAGVSSVVGLTVTDVHDHALVYDAAGIHAITGASFVADVSSVAGPAVTGVHALSLSMLFLCCC